MVVSRGTSRTLERVKTRLTGQTYNNPSGETCKETPEGLKATIRGPPAKDSSYSETNTVTSAP